MDLIQKIDERIKQHDFKKAELKTIEVTINNLEENVKNFPTEIELLENVRAFLQVLSETTRTQITSGLEEIVTRCLQSVFGTHLSFEIEAKLSNNKVGVEFYVKDDRYDPVLRTKPEGNLGGGVIDTVAIGLRFGLLKVLPNIPDGPILLDEPAKMVSAGFVPNIASLVNELSQIFGRQIIMATHHIAIVDVLDNVVYVNNEDGTSIIE